MYKLRCQESILIILLFIIEQEIRLLYCRSRAFYPDFIKILSRFYQDFIKIYQDFIKIYPDSFRTHIIQIYTKLSG